MQTIIDHGISGALPPPVPAALDDARALYVEGLLALRNGRADTAASRLVAALRLDPKHQGMRRNLVRALLELKQYDHALAQADVALAEAPEDAELHYARGTALNGLGQSSRACAAFDRALSLRPDHAPSWLNMANASADLDDLASAETLCRTAIRFDPAMPEAHASLGYLLTMQGRLAEAVTACEAAIRLCPDFSQAHWNMAVTRLLQGDLPRGLEGYEWRNRHAKFKEGLADLPGQKWDGRSVPGQRILVRAEQGFGDAIQFARYLSLIRDAGNETTFACAPTIVPLIQCLSGIRVIPLNGPLPAYDAWIDQMSLARVFGTTLDTIPAAEGYLRPDPGRVDAWRRRLPEGRKVGIALSGNRAHHTDRLRSIPLTVALPLPTIPGLSFVNLQHGEAARGLGLRDWSQQLTDYAETAALIENLDLVVTVDTSVAHVAGAMGKPVWIMLPHAPDWRWMLNRADSPWYRSATLFRQPTAGDWKTVLRQVMNVV